MSSTSFRVAALAAATALVALLLPVPAVAADTAHSAAAATPVTEKVPYAMDSSNQAAWWTPVATYKGRGQYTYFAFNEPGSTAATHRPAIARRDPDGAWSLLPLVNRDFATVLLHAFADAHPLSPRGVKEALERVHMLPASMLRL